MDNLDKLKKFRRDIEIIDSSQAETAELPGEWVEIFKEDNMIKRKDKVVEIWKENISNELPLLVGYLEKNIQTVDLIKSAGKYSMLYGIRMETGETDYFEGRSTKESVSHELLNGMPQKLKNFYLNVHNGFIYFYGGNLGILPVDKAAHFSEYEWEIIDELEQPLELNLETTYGFFGNGGGDYLAVDYNNCEDDKATLWYHDDDPFYNINFWEEADSWITANFK